MEKIALTPEEREFCSLVARAGTVNHFSEERIALDKRIGNTPDLASKKVIFQKVMDRLDHFIREWESVGKADVRLYGQQDREIVSFTLLFQIFHRYMLDFDQHILEQIQSGEKSIPVHFATETMDLFAKRGFSVPESLQFFEVFFQMRRAYFFIENQIIGASPCMTRLRENLWNNIFTGELLFYKNFLLNRMDDFSTLILGDTGSGKGTAAAAIGRSGYIPFDKKTNIFSESFTKTLVSVNLSQFSTGLIESELFGHRKGAFTGAIEDHRGIFDMCSKHGSIFLDEIGDVSIPTQIKLLQILQDRTFTPVGSHTKHRFEGRVIGATNKDIYTLRQTGAFRDDFFYRLCSDIITVPSLSTRIQENPDELPCLIRHVVKGIVGVEHEQLSNEIGKLIDIQLGINYTWPGNVRELEQCVRRMILKKEYQGDHKNLGSDSISCIMNSLRNEKLSADSLLGQYCRLLYQRHGTFEAVSEIVKLDRRTVKKYVELESN